MKMIFRHACNIHIRFVDMDALGHVNNANFFTYFEESRIEYFKDVIGENINWAETGLILAHAEIDYKIPIVLGDNVIAYTKISRLGTKSFEVQYALVKKTAEGEIELAVGKTVLVCFDYKKNSTINIPEKWRKALMEFEGLE